MILINFRPVFSSTELINGVTHTSMKCFILHLPECSYVVLYQQASSTELVADTIDILSDK